MQRHPYERQFFLPSAREVDDHTNSTGFPLALPSQSVFLSRPSHLNLSEMIITLIFYIFSRNKSTPNSQGLYATLLLYLCPNMANLLSPTEFLWNKHLKFFLDRDFKFSNPPGIGARCRCSCRSVMTTDDVNHCFTDIALNFK